MGCSRISLTSTETVTSVFAILMYISSRPAVCEDQSHTTQAAAPNRKRFAEQSAAGDISQIIRHSLMYYAASTTEDGFENGSARQKFPAGNPGHTSHKPNQLH
jgi:hypothetical protein